jgi:hypothetical protein
MMLVANWAQLLHLCLPTTPTEFKTQSHLRQNRQLTEPIVSCLSSHNFGHIPSLYAPSCRMEPVSFHPSHQSDANIIIIMIIMIIITMIISMLMPVKSNTYLRVLSGTH